MTERTRNELLDELVRMTNARDLLANTADRLIEERDAARRQLKGAVGRAETAERLLGRIYGFVTDRQRVPPGLKAEIRAHLAATKGQSKTAPASDDFQRGGPDAPA